MVWIDPKTELLFDQDGRAATLRNIWTFDFAYSKKVIDDAHANAQYRVDLTTLATTNVTSLQAYGYFTAAEAGGVNAVFRKPIDYSLQQNSDRKVVLRFTLPFEASLPPSETTVVKVFDGTGAIKFSPEPQDPITLVDAPPSCSSEIVTPPPRSVGDGFVAAAAAPFSLIVSCPPASRIER